MNVPSVHRMIRLRKKISVERKAKAAAQPLAVCRSLSNRCNFKGRTELMEATTKTTNKKLTRISTVHVLQNAGSTDMRDEQETCSGAEKLAPGNLEIPLGQRTCRT